MMDIKTPKQVLNPAFLKQKPARPEIELFKKEFIALFYDNNQLNRGFYAELLHIIGLEEILRDNKKLIVRKNEKERDGGSIIENAIERIDAKNKLNNTTAEQYGKTKEEQLFGVALDLTITWINRILFLKLLESQILKYHKGNRDYAFLSIDKLNDYNDLDMLFFSVLALRKNERNESVKSRFERVPYLNSSLFEITEIEDKTICIDSLQNNISLALYAGSVLRGGTSGRSNDRNDYPKMKPLEYLLRFLDAYDFSSEGSEDIQEENKPLISASVLGLIFEKINGYKDGSFFTPSFITMYMCRETITRAVVQKFNEVKGWNCLTIIELYNKIENIDEANVIFNSLRICDPAVGSGHFLVSALNEMIRLKSELGILTDKSGRRLKDYRVTVENDELIVMDNEGNHFTYNPENTESRRVQEAFFNEKQSIIENCLFGVDINPNSVKICQLRLWIELLKNAYYHPGTGELETLPNIDINIKCGNSLINRFDLRGNYATLPFSTQQTLRIATQQYKAQVVLYKSTNDKTDKKHIRENIARIKETFSQVRNPDDEDYRKWKDAEAKSTQHFYSMSFEDMDEWNKKLDQLRAEADSLSEKYEQKLKTLYSNSVEWSFEFPEVLDDDGNFVGFDVIIGNPPYVFARNSKSKGITDSDKSYYYKNFNLSEYQINLYPVFIEMGTNLLINNGALCLITPNNWLTLNTTKKLRQFVLKQSNVTILNFYKRVFESAGVDSAIVYYNKNSATAITGKVRLAEWEKEYTFIGEIEKERFLKSKDFVINIEAMKGNEILNLLDKIETNSVLLSEISNVKVGLKAYQTGKGQPKQTEEIKRNRVFHSKIDGEGCEKYLDGKDVCRYSLGWSGEFLKYGKHLAEPRANFDIFSTPRILVRQIPSLLPYCINACYTNETLLNDLNSMNIIYIKVSPLYLLGILNSRLISYWFAHKFGKLQRGTFPQFKINELAQFPVADISAEKQQPVIDRVNQILSAKKENPAADTTVLEMEIDELVYQLYGLTEDEISIIEKPVLIPVHWAIDSRNIGP